MSRLIVLLLLLAAPAGAQIATPGVPTSSEESLTVSTTALGVTADLCGDGNRDGALFYVVDNGVYLSLHSPTATPDSNDFALNAGDFAYVRPASKARSIRQSADTNVKVQCVSQ